jgi:hypothetical protein
MVTRKQYLGQYYTTNHEYILQGMQIPNNDPIIVIEPFAGSGELIAFLQKQNLANATVEAYDIDPPLDNVNGYTIVKRDTLLNPPSYKGKFVLTNPPYLARNKTADKELYNCYGVNDKYKCFIKSLIADRCDGGIVIIPLNFWSSLRRMDCLLRKEFMNTFNVHLVNVFEQQVFADTSYTVCSMSFSRRDNIEESISNAMYDIPFTFYPTKQDCVFSIGSPDWIIGQEIYAPINNPVYTVSRWIEGEKDNRPNTNIMLFALDDGRSKRIRLEISLEPFHGKVSDRTKASLMVVPEIGHSIQEELVSKFNAYLEEMRNKYNSMFLCNYRESKDYARKRISFKLAYLIVQRVLQDIQEVHHCT